MPHFSAAIIVIIVQIKFKGIIMSQADVTEIANPEQKCEVQYAALNKVLVKKTMSLNQKQLTDPVSLALTAFWYCTVYCLLLRFQLPL